MTTFTDLGLAEPLLRAIAEEGYDTPTPIQAKAIPPALDGRDVLGLAQTGTGKTAAFALPMLQRLSAARRRPAPGHVRALILTPTRELALQVADGFRTYGRHLRLATAVIHGGVGINPQIAACRRGLDVLVATPGRALDIIRQGHLALGRVEIFVLDEADRMLDMGFIPDVRAIAAELPKDRQTLLFSATLPETIVGLADGLTRDRVKVEVTPPATTVERIDQRVMFVDTRDKLRLLVDLLNGPAVTRAIVFTRTKRGANKVSEQLAKHGLDAGVIHGNKSQSARERALGAFRDGRMRALVATDIAARGIDVDGVSHVINFDLPNEPESYVHRIGRTARAGADGVALSLCASDEIGYLRAIEKTIRRAVPVDEAHAFHVAGMVATAPAVRGSGPGRSQRNEERAPRNNGQARPGTARPNQGRPNQARPSGPATAGRAAQPRPSQPRPAQGRTAQQARPGQSARTAEVAPAGTGPRHPRTRRASA